LKKSDEKLVSFIPGSQWRRKISIFSHSDLAKPDVENILGHFDGAEGEQD
jgi:hypothetical protein